MKKIISTTDAPAAVGPYSQAVVTGGFLFTAGQIPLDPHSGIIVDGDVKAQTKRVMDNLAAVLKAAGCSFDDVIKTTCFLQDMNDFAAFNEVYASYFGSQPPSRSTVQVARLPKDARVEVELVAKVP
ncbi:MAG: RidA family protein [Trueperaceae bacterium]|nr:RidA family protein [Trueperaceae bacterium]